LIPYFSRRIFGDFKRSFENKSGSDRFFRKLFGFTDRFPGFFQFVRKNDNNVKKIKLTRVLKDEHIHRMSPRDKEQFVAPCYDKSIVPQVKNAVHALKNKKILSVLSREDYKELLTS